jgi:hypothetical protein
MAQNNRQDSMWLQIGKTLRRAMDSNGATVRLCICLIVVTLCVLACAWGGVFG